MAEAADLTSPETAPRHQGDSVDSLAKAIVAMAGAPKVFTGVVSAIEADGTLLVVPAGTLETVPCDLLLTPVAPSLLPGAQVVAVLPAGGQRGVVLGAIGRYGAASPAAQVRLQAGESMTLSCGQASIDLRADGKVVIKGDDVLVRAKGTKRIRAGSVSIN